MDERMENPWAGSGHSVEDAKTAQEVMQRAQLDWNVEGRQLYYFEAMASDPILAHSHKAIVRDDTGGLLGVVGQGWRPLQNHEAFDFVDRLIGAGAIRYSQAGSFKGGKIIWIQAEFAEAEILPGDVHKKYLMLVSAFDGSLAVRIGETNLRMFCMNVFPMIAKQFRDATGVQEVRIRHTQSLREKMEAAQNALAVAIKHGEYIDDIMRAFTRVRMTTGMWEDFANYLIPDPEEGKSSTRAENARSQLLTLAVTGRGQDIPGVAGTAYAALNAVTEYVNYYRTTRGKVDEDRQAKRFESTLFGAGARFVTDALFKLNEFTANAGIQIH